ncbi:hypothetical protein Taro_024348 [Colocasia esculenta]|uniref:Dynein light chain n=1 Tax=Colocasia esculenta TaxID=4460 RepID=A0A843V646_COLES|nr:hypothetical protein [Colocasia esculenta]
MAQREDNLPFPTGSRRQRRSRQNSWDGRLRGCDIFDGRHDGQTTCNDEDTPEHQPTPPLFFPLDPPGSSAAPPNSADSRHRLRRAAGWESGRSLSHVRRRKASPLKALVFWFLDSCIEFDEVYGPGWQCVVGYNFGCFFTHTKGTFIYFCLETLHFLIFKGVAA